MTSNNLLTVIGVNADLIGAEAPETKYLHPIRDAVARGSELTQLLLAFSRRQPLAPHDLDISELISDMANLLHRTLGEGIKISTSTPEDLWFALADKNQLENALLNLGLNARDAMPQGGKLRVDCSNVTVNSNENPELQRGEYVRISVSDTGEGIPPEVLSRVFEPFFTTKEVGKGSGLGLSMVYGFARQSGGLAQISSEPDQGTRVDILLPRGTTHSNRDKARRVAAELPHGGGQPILLLEDQDDVRRGLYRLLEVLGYRVHEAADAMEAKAVLATVEGIRLALCDILLSGGVSGVEFAEDAFASYPDLKIVFMSGNPPKSIGEAGSKVSRCTLLSKPISMETLGETLHRELRKTEAGHSG